MILDLKIWPEQFAKLSLQAKPFDVRHEPMPARPGDVVRFREWSPDHRDYSGRVIYAQIRYQERSDDFPPEFEIPRGVVVSHLALVVPDAIVGEDQGQGLIARP